MRIIIVIISFISVFYFASCGHDKSVNNKQLFSVKIGELWGLTDTNCSYVIQPIYDYLGEFYNSYALVKKGDRISYINDSGIVSHPFDFIDGTHFNEYKAFVITKDSIIASIDTSMKIIFTLPDVEFASVFSGGLASVRMKGKYGYIDAKGKSIVPCKYDAVTSFSNKMAAVANYSTLNDSSFLQWFFIDVNGNEIIPAKFSDVLPFHNDIAAVKDGEKWKWINKKGNHLFNMIYDECHAFQEGYASFRSGDKWGIINSKGEIVLEPSYPMIGNCKNGFFPFSLGPEANGYLDTNGKICIQPVFKSVSSFNNNFAYVVKDSRISIIDIRGNVLCGDRFDSAPGYRGNLLGFIDIPLNSFVEIASDSASTNVNF
jgi:hypothetical protein